VSIKRWILPLLLVAGAWPGIAVAAPVRDPVTHKPFSCPDPNVLDARTGAYRYYTVCTSDYYPDAFPIRGSNDLRSWKLLGYVFPAHHQPWWALQSPAGRYWSPELYRIGGRWVVYFAATYDAVRVALKLPGAATPAPWVIGVATARSLRGPWNSRLLHYRGQFNALGEEQENYGGDIDPSMVQDPRSGQMYLFWAQQHTSIWAAKLSSDGLELASAVHQVLWAEPGWECGAIDHSCTVEGPAPLYHDGWFYLLYSGASTWDGSYAVGAAVARDPLSVFTRIGDSPILRSGYGWQAPGGASHPVTGPDGQQYLFYHATRGADTSRASENRFLMVGHFRWTGAGGFYPIVNHGQAG
jgi:arabinan endo-1,5-alpha-L-arabinosidase